MDLDEALDDLHRADPDEFTQRRGELVRQLRATGAREDAARLQRERKPTRPAWAVNQVAHRHADVLADLLATGDALRDATGDASDMRRLGDELRSVLTDLRDLAGEALRTIGTEPDAHLDEVEQTLMTAAVQPEHRDDVVRGRLQRPLPPAGFGALVGVDLATTSSGDREDQRRELRRLEKEIQRLERRVRELERQAEGARDRVEALRDELSAAQEDATEKERRAERAHDELTGLEERAGRLRDGSEG